MEIGRLREQWYVFLCPSQNSFVASLCQSHIALQIMIKMVLVSLFLCLLSFSISLTPVYVFILHFLFLIWSLLFFVFAILLLGDLLKICLINLTSSQRLLKVR